MDGKSALVVVDMQRGVIADAHDRDGVVGRIARMVEAFRGRGTPVVWVRHEDEELVRGTDDWDLWPGMGQQFEDPLVTKNHNSSFSATGLEAYLRDHHIGHIYLMGAASGWCIRATAHAALDRGFNLTLVSDGHTARDMVLASGSVLPAALLIEEINTVFQWLSYPGVKSRYLGTEQCLAEGRAT